MTEKASHLIDRQTEELLEAERELLDQLVTLAEAVEERGEDARNARLLREHLDEPFLLVIVGEVKSGKSTFINALLEYEACAVGPTPLTDRIHLLHHGQTEQERALEEYLLERRIPVELLKDVSIVDTPGTNSILRQHGEITERFIPRSDLVLFLTSVDRPYSESENQFLAHISDHWRKKVVFLVSKIDGRRPEDVQEVVDYVRRSCLEHHGFEPRVFPLSAAKEKAGDEDSGFDQVRQFIRETLSGAEKTRLKLESPLHSSLTVLESLGSTLEHRDQTLKEDHEWVQSLDRQVNQTCDELQERSHQYLTDLLEMFRDCERRGDEFFDQTLRLKNIGLMRNAERLQEKFQQEVLGDLDSTFNETMNRALDWLIREEIALYERSSAYLQERMPRSEETDSPALPSKPARFEYRREEILGSMVEAYDQQRSILDVEGQSQRLMEESQRGLMRQLGLTGAAVVVGAGSVALFASLWAAVTGVTVALGVGLAGFVILPGVKRRARRQFQARLDEMTRKVREAYHRVIGGELQRARDRLRQGWDAFLVFYRTESTQLEDHDGTLRELKRQFADLEQRLRRVVEEASREQDRTS